MLKRVYRKICKSTGEPIGPYLLEIGRDRRKNAYVTGLGMFTDVYLVPLNNLKEYKVLYIQAAEGTIKCAENFQRKLVLPLNKQSDKLKSLDYDIVCLYNGKYKKRAYLKVSHVMKTVKRHNSFNIRNIRMCLNMTMEIEDVEIQEK